MKKNNDESILAGFKQGEEKAVKQIFWRFHKELVAFATRITGNRYEAQDIVVEAFLKILPRAKDFTSMENIRAFLYVVVRRASYTWVEKQDKRGRHPFQQFFRTDCPFIQGTGEFRQNIQ